MSKAWLFLTLLLLAGCGGALKPYTGPQQYGHFTHQY